MPSPNRSSRNRASAPRWRQVRRLSSCRHLPHPEPVDAVRSEALLITTLTLRAITLRAITLRAITLCAIAFLLLSGCASIARDTPASIPPGASETVALGVEDLGFGRTYRLHRPPSVEASSDPVPLVVALHGGLATARIFEQQTGLSQLADEHGFLVVYPNGVGILSLLRHWNAEWCCAKAMKEGIDDLARVRQVIDDVAAHWPVDRERIYLVGYSNGGMLAHLYAARNADELAGLAVFAGPADVYRAPDASSSPAVLAAAAPLPVLLLHGTDDRRLPVQGSEAVGTPLGAFESAELWAEANGCAESDRPPPATRRSAGVESFTYCGGSATPVELLVLQNWGHEWPGTRRLSNKPRHALFGFDAATEIWRFFERTATSPAEGPRDRERSTP